MSDPFTCSGKEILRNGQHFADAHEPAAAEAITIMLNKGRLFSTDIGQDELDRVREALWA